MGPGLDGEIGLGVESDTEDDDGEEAGDVARQLPVFPFSRLTIWGFCLKPLRVACVFG